MEAFFVHNPLAFLFLICGVGYGIGKIHWGKKGPKLGSAAVIFVGLFFGAIDPKFQLPTFVGSLGLVFLMYAVGSQSASGITGSLHGKNLKQLICGLIVILGAVALVSLCSPLIVQHGGYRAAVFSGILSNSTGLAAIEDALRISGASGQALKPPIVAFSLTYPTSLFIPILVVPLAQWFSHTSLKAEAESDPEYVQSHLPLRNAVVLVTLPSAVGRRLDSFVDGNGRIQVVYGELVRGDHRDLAAGKTALALDDQITIVGTQPEIDSFAKLVGEILPVDPAQIDTFELRRVVVSKPDVTNLTLRSLRLMQSFGFKITRVRRGDLEFVPDENTKLELGDRIRILSLRENSNLIRGLFGDSMTALGEVDIFAISTGIILGVLLGSLSLPLPGGLFLRLGLAGGPLLSGLLLSRIGRTGPIVWKTPDPAIRVIYQIGLVFYSAYLGVQGGDLLWSTLKEGSGIASVLLAIFIGLVLGLFCLWLACKVFKMSLNRALGVYCGVLTQPIVLDYVEGVAGNEMASAPFAALFPACLVVKIVLSQALLYFLK